MIISLAHEPPVRLGPLRLLPPTREIVRDDGRREVVEPRVMQVLLALARADGAIVTRDALTESCWEGRIVGEDAINRVISRLRRVARGTGQGVFRIETVTQVGYRLVAETALEPAAPPSAASPSLAFQPAAPRTQMARPRWLMPVAAAVLLTVLGFGAWRLNRAPAPVARPAAARHVPQLRIEPFTALSPDVPPALIAQAREEIVTAFGITNLVDIVADPPPGKAGPLAWTLSGAVGRTGPNLRFVVHLTHDATDAIVWSSAIDRSAGPDGEGLRSLAAAVQEVVAIGLTAAAGYRGGELPDSTLALFIQWNADTSLTEGRYRHGEEELRRAVAQTPDFAEGWSWLAAALGATATASDNPADIAAARAAAPPIVATALRYRPNDPVALMARAKLMAPEDFMGRQAAFLAATAQPTSETGSEHSGYGMFLLNVGRIDEAIRQTDIAYELDRLAGGLAGRYARALGMGGQTEPARKLIRQELALWPDDAGLRMLDVRGALWAHDYDAAGRALQADPEMTPAARAILATAFVALKADDPRRLEAAGAATAQLARDPNTLTPLVVATLGALGRNAEAIAAVDRLIAAHNAMAAEILFDPTLAAARQTPEFAALAARAGLLDYWRRSGRAPDFCAPAAAPALCAGLKRPAAGHAA